MSSTERWWWDLATGRAVRDDERGPDHDVLGPYPSREAAEHWRDRHEAREDEWEEEDERWLGEDAGDESDPGDGGAGGGTP